MSAAPEPGRVGTHLLGFAFFGWAWPVFVIAGRVLSWIVYAAIVAALLVAAGARRVATMLRLR